MNSCILYGSKYGSARQYGQALSAQTSIPAYSYAQAPKLSNMDVLVYVGSLYAGGVLGLRKTCKVLDTFSGGKLLLATVGLGDPALPETQATIRSMLERQIPASLRQKIELFHLRGRLDYSQLSLGHRTAMAMLHLSLMGTPVENRTAEDQAFLETYGKQVDFIDFNTLAPLVQALRR